MVFPICILWGIQMEILRKLSIIGVFTVGAIGMCASLIRVVELRQNARGGRPSGSWLAVWAMVEAGIGKLLLHKTSMYQQPITLTQRALLAVMVACLPTFGLLMAPSASKKCQIDHLSGNSALARPVTLPRGSHIMQTQKVHVEYQRE